MIILPREEPRHLRIRRLLKARMTFSDKEMRQFLNDEKGFAGECLFDDLITKSGASTYVQLNGLLLEWNGNLFQIDSLLASPYRIYLYDVKNFEGDYYIEGDRWYSKSGVEVKNPLIQLK